MNVKDKIVEVCKNLDELDEYKNTLADSLSNIDSKVCDLLHLIEYNSLKTNQCYRMIREIHNLRLERRKIKNDMELTKVFYDHQNKLIEKNNRQILLSFVGKTDKSLKNSKYNNRKYTDEEIKELLGV